MSANVPGRWGAGGDQSKPADKRVGQLSMSLSDHYILITQIQLHTITFLFILCIIYNICSM